MAVHEGLSRPVTVEQRLDQLEKRNRRLTVGWIAMMVAIAIQFSACGDDPAGPSTNCDVSDKYALAGRNLSECSLGYANLEGADLEDAKEVPELDASQEETACWSDCGD